MNLNIIAGSLQLQYSSIVLRSVYEFLSAMKSQAVFRDLDLGLHSNVNPIMPNLPLLLNKFTRISRSSDEI